MKNQISIKNGLLAIIVLCWLVPIGIVMSLAGFLLGKSYQQSAEQELDASAKYAVRQVQLQLEESVHASKGVSYDGVVRDAYRCYKQQLDHAELYRSVNDYLSQKFSRSPQYKAVFLTFWNREIGADVYLLNSGITGYELLQECQEKCPRILSIMEDADTQTRFIMLNGHFYLARNLLDSHFKPYASMVMMLDPQVVFQPMNGLSRIEDQRLTVDDITFTILDEGKFATRERVVPGDMDVSYGIEVDGHDFVFSANLQEYNIWKENPWILWLVFSVSFMVLPMLIIVISLFRRHITHPMETLAQAHQLVQSGNRGYEIKQESPNTEFAGLYDHFNSMSTELKNQFERSYLEQQASQRAQIKALQSQINPHFLNNTLEIINWEARLAENDRISNMIEALSTMLGAALDRKGRSQIPLKEELGYVDSYLYIIQVRIGEGFHVHKEISQDVLGVLIPRLILQPIVENAVEHDITRNHGGDLWVRAYQKDSEMILEVEHDGTLTETDEENVRTLLSDEGTVTHVGLRNVSQRLKLIYGSKGSITISQTNRETVLARICFPISEENGSERDLA